MFCYIFRNIEIWRFVTRFISISAYTRTFTIPKYADNNICLEAKRAVASNPITFSAYVIGFQYTVHTLCKKPNTNLNLKATPKRDVSVVSNIGTVWSCALFVM